MSGKLHVRIETDTVTATTYFKNLVNHKFRMLQCYSIMIYDCNVQVIMMMTLIKLSCMKLE